MITAEEARKISGPGVKDHLDIIERRIRAAAEKKAQSVTIRDQPYCDWAYNHPEIGDTGKAVVRELEEAGFKVDMFYEEKQFADMGMRISWG